MMTVSFVDFNLDVEKLCGRRDWSASVSLAAEVFTFQGVQARRLRSSRMRPEEPRLWTHRCFHSDAPGLHRAAKRLNYIPADNDVSLKGPAEGVRLLIKLCYR